MKSVRYFFYFFFLITASFKLYAKDPVVKYLGIEQGLSNNVVTDIYQDYNGFMWFGTYDGLNRYDGYGFKIFRNTIGDSTSLFSNTIFAMAGDESHNIWVGCQNGVSVYNPVNSQFQRVKYRRTLSSAAEFLPGIIHEIEAVPGGEMLVASQLKGFIVYKKNERIGVQIPIMAGGQNSFDYNVTAVEYDKQRGFVWVFVKDYGLYAYNLLKQEMRLVSYAVKQANCLRLTRQNKLMLGDDMGLYLYKPETEKFSENVLAVKSKVVNFCEDKRGDLWIATDGAGVHVLHANSDMFTSLLSETGAPLVNSNAIYDIYEDNDGRKWVGTLRGGINVIESRRSLFQTITDVSNGANKPVDNFILSFCEDEYHNVWIGTDGAGLRYWDRKKNIFNEYKKNPENSNSISSNFITNIARDYLGDVWVSTWFGGLNRLKKNTAGFEKFVCYNPVSQTEEKNVWLVYEDRNKQLWASATNDGSLYLFNRVENRFELFDPAIVNIQSIAEDSSGNLWAGNYSSLIKIDRRTRNNQTFYIGYPVRSIHEDSKKNFWVGTQDGGLLLFDRTTGNYTRYTTTDGLPNNTILRILEDKEGNLWLSTFNGLCRFTPDQKGVRNFFQSDGLQSNQFSFNAALRLQSGEFLFGGIKGFNLFHPSLVESNAGMPPVFLNGLQISGKSVTSKKYVTQSDLERIQEVTIPYNEAAMSIDFVALEYSGGEKIKYAYFLKGWDKEWNYVNTIRVANYSRLEEGNYEFLVKTTNVDGSWGNEILLLKVIVLPPWYRTWWAYFSYLLVIVGLIYVYIRFKTRQQRLKYEVRLAQFETEKEKEITEKKLTFFTNVSHEFRTPLTLIINPLKESMATSNDQRDNKNLVTAYRNARRLLSLVDQLLLFRRADKGDDILKVSKVDISELCTEVYQCFKQVAKTKEIEYKLILPEEPVEVFVDYERIEIALFNLLSNAFKFTDDKGMIVFEVSNAINEVQISIKDNGCGISETDRERIFEKFQRGEVQAAMQKSGFGIGLYLVKHFVESHKGKVVCESELNKGTTFLVSLKKGSSHLPESYLLEDPGKKYEILQELAGETEQPVADPVNAIMRNGKTADEVITEKKSILCIDDNAEIRQYLRQIFESQYLVYEASSGEEGLRLASLHVPDLIISDINMEGMDGVDLCNKIKQSETLGHIPVILLTSATSADSKLRGIKEGADDYITKPFDKEILLARIESLVRSRQTLQKYFFDSITLKKSSEKVPAEFQDFLKKCIAVIEENIDTEDFTIKKFSKAMGMSHSGLYQKVRSISGQSLNAFIRSIRIRRAAVLMLTENMNVSQAAFQVGINDPKYFREQFVKLFGMTPSVYIKKYRDSFNRDFNVVRES